MKLLITSVCLAVTINMLFGTGIVLADSAFNGRQVPVLLYHHIDNVSGQWHVTPVKFEKELKWLSSNGYHTISLEAYLNERHSNREWSEKIIILTFDDGNLDNYTYAFPLLKQYGMTGTFFIASELIDRSGYMTWGQVLELQRANMEIGAHTLHHVFLTRLSNIRAFVEIFGSRISLMLHLRTPILVFAYPYNDHSSRIVELARLAGFQGAVIVSPHTGDQVNDPFQVPRITILSGERLRIFAAVIKRYA